MNSIKSIKVVFTTNSFLNSCKVVVVVLYLFQDVMVLKVNEALLVVQVLMVAQGGKAFQGRLELRDCQACVVNPGIQAHVVVMASQDYQVLVYFALLFISYFWLTQRAV